ncbi:hypothetical protein ABFS83_10G053200 [Erythranthe nasuta]
MADSSSSNSLSGKEFEAVLHKDKHENHRNKETHGLRDDIDANTSMSDVKAPNVFERAKEEIEALVEVIHPKKESKKSSKSEKSEPYSEKDAKAAKQTVKAKEEIETVGRKPNHRKETHGMSFDIDEDTPISEVKGPNVFERAKEEIEALIQTIHPKKDSVPKKEGGFSASVGKRLEKICSPRGHNKD